MTLNNIIELNELKDEIEKLDKKNQIHIMHLLHKYNIQINFNINGGFVNLSLVNDDVITVIKDYLNELKIPETSVSIN